MDGSLFLISRADIFSIYPKIFKELLVADDVERQKAAGRLPKDVFNVPSDYEWKLKVYFRLLEVQRKLNEKEEQGEYASIPTYFHAPSCREIDIRLILQAANETVHTAGR